MKRIIFIISGLLIVLSTACSNANSDDDKSKTSDLQTPVTGPPTAGRLLASQCAQCHGTDGRSVSGIEDLAGESASEIIEEMSEMRQENKREMMTFQAHGYTDEQVRLIADYLGRGKGGENDD